MVVIEKPILTIVMLKRQASLNGLKVSVNKKKLKSRHTFVWFFVCVMVVRFSND